MTDEHAKALVEHRLQKAEDALRAAQYMYEQSMLIFAMNRIYYSMYYAVQALLAIKGKSFSKQEGLSVNMTIKKILESSLGVKPKDYLDNISRFEEFCGIWTNTELSEFEKKTETLLCDDF